MKGPSSSLSSSTLALVSREATLPRGGRRSRRRRLQVIGIVLAEVLGTIFVAWQHLSAYYQLLVPTTNPVDVGGVVVVVNFPTPLDTTTTITTTTTTQKESSKLVQWQQSLDPHVSRGLKELKADGAVDVQRKQQQSQQSQQQQQQQLQTTLHSPVVVDIVSIGSTTRPDYQQTQRDVLGTHKAVRHFVALTEDTDTFEQSCSEHLTNDEDVKAIANYCRATTTPSKNNNNNSTTSGRLYRELRQRFADWDNFLSTKPSPAGWVCAQRRGADGLSQLLQYYQDQPNPELPDYVILMDDDTHLDLSSVLEYLQALYDPSTDAIVMAGCLVHLAGLEPEFHFTLPFGGWGTFLSRAALENLMRPIEQCDNSSSSSAASSPFQQNACERLHANLLNEQRYYKPGMSVADLIQAYASNSLFRNYRQWSEEPHGDNVEDDSSGSFCLHSDWIWGYFFNYYNIGEHTGNPAQSRIPEARYTSYRRSESSVASRAPKKTKMALEGQCAFQKKKCTDDSHICHYVTPQQMNNLTAVYQSRPDAAQDYYYYPTTTVSSSSNNNNNALLVQDPSWKALWKRPLYYEQQRQLLQIDPVAAKTNSATTTAVTINQQNQQQKIKVFLYPHMHHSVEHELKHYAWDGIEKSDRLERTTNFLEAPVWIVDTRRAGFASPKFCTRFVQIAKQMAAARKTMMMAQQQQQQQQEEVEQQQEQPPREWKIAMLHWDDIVNDDFLDCYRAIRAMDSTRVYRFKRSMVEGRHWNETMQFVELGRMVQFGNWRDHSAAPVQQMNYGVRSDVVEGLQQQLVVQLQQTQKSDQQLTNKGSVNQLATAEEIVLQPTRATDVSCFWPLAGRESSKITHEGSQLRDAVSQALFAFFKQQQQETSKNNLKVFVGLAGKAKDSGRNQAQDSYLAKLLDSKIVVVAQKDRWEDHYRLMEALASGAMVMTDPMLTLPIGLQNGTSVVVYNSLDDLVSKVQYYLNASSERQEIAMEGYRVAMNMHRSYHMMERIVFENLLSQKNGVLANV